MILHDELNGGFEYQYHLKDHLGNTRVVFTTKAKTFTFFTDYEELGNDDLALFDNVTIQSNDIFDHTDANGTVYTKSQFLNGAENSRVGSVIPIPVGMGDTLNISAWAKYTEITTTATNAVTSIASSLIGAINGGIGGNTEGATSTVNNNFGSGSLIGSSGFPIDNSAPHAYLNVIFLPEGDDITLQNGLSFAYDQIAAGASQLVGQPKNSNYDELRIDNFVAPANGHVLVYFSNESATLVDVYFDDMTITVNEHPVIQRDDYYPFGLTFNSWQRSATSKENRFKYNGKEKIDDLDIGWYDYGARMYMADIGRWGVVDPLAEKYMPVSPYNYVANNPINMVDPDGMRIIAADKKSQEHIMNYFNDVLGEGHGFSFKKNGTLRFKQKDVAEGKEYSDKQSSIFDGIKEVVDDNETTIHAKISEDENIDVSIEVQITQETSMNYSEDQMEKDSNGNYQGGQFRELSLFGSDPFGVLVINRKVARTQRFDAGNGEQTEAYESAAFIHELLDHGLYFVRTGKGVPPKGSSKKDEVKYQNKALKIKGSLERTGTDHGIKK